MRRALVFTIPSLAFSAAALAQVGQPGPMAAPPGIAAPAPPGAPATAPQRGQPGPMEPPPGLVPPAQAVPGPMIPGQATGPGEPPPTGVQLSVSLSGQWVGEDRSGVAAGLPPIPTVLFIRDDGTFNQFSTFQNGLSEQIWGTIAVQAVSPTSAYVTITPTGWNPRELCPGTLRGPGACMPIGYQTETKLWKLIDPNTCDTGTIRMQRQH